MAGMFRPGFELYRSTKTSDGQGGWTEGYVKIADISGRAYPARGLEALRGEQQTGVVRWTFACPAATDIRERDQIRFDGRKLKVEAVPVTGSGRRKQCACEEDRS